MSPHHDIITFACFLSSTLHQSERNRKNAENELADTSARLSEVTLQVTALTNDKRRLEGDMAAMQSDLDDAINNQRAAEERAERLAAENARLADELRQEQEKYRNSESLRKQRDIEIREVTIRLEEAEAFAIKEGKRLISKLQARVSAVVDVTICYCCSYKLFRFLLMLFLLLLLQVVIIAATSCSGCCSCCFCCFCCNLLLLPVTSLSLLLLLLPLLLQAITVAATWKW